jgi:hypothetical protein
VTVEFALFLSPEGIALAHRQQAGHWALVAESGLNGDDLGASMAGLKAAATARGGADAPVLLVLPDDQVLYTSFTAPADDAALVEERITEGLDGMTPYAVSELFYDWRAVDMDRVKVAVVAKETLGEATEFASTHGFKSAGFAAMPPDERFPGMPLFGETRDDWGLDRAGMAFGSDDWVAPSKAPTSKPDSEKDPKAEPSPTGTASTGEPEPKPDPAPEVKAKPQADPAPAAEPVPQPGTPPRDASAPDAEHASGSERKPDNSATATEKGDTSGDAGTGAETTDDEAPTPIADPTLDYPIAPLEPQEETLPQSGAAPPDGAPRSGPATPLQAAAAPKADKPATATRSKVAGASARPLTADKSTDVPARPENAAQITPPGTPPEDQSVDPDTDPTPRFSARRGKAPRPDSGAGDIVSTRSSRLGFGASGGGDGRTVLHPDAAPAPVSKPDPRTPERPVNQLAAQLARVRDASRSRKQSPGPEPVAKTPAPAARGDSEAAGPVTAFGVTPVNAKAPRETPPDMVPDTEAADTSGLAVTRRSGNDSAQPPSPDERATADQAFTTGLLARKPAEQTGPSLRTGLILTVILLILLALIAIWSVLFLPDSPMGRLWNGGTDTETATLSQDRLDTPAPPAAITAPPALGALDTGTAAPGSAPDQAEAPVPDPDEVAALTSGAEPMPDAETAVAPEVQAEPVLPDIDADLDLPPLPPLAEDMLPSLEETERIYAEDEIWVRPPDRPSVEPLSSLNDLYVASIDPEVPSMDAIALADPQVNPGELLRRIPPPPPFGDIPVRDARGLVQPTPEGVLTPEGAFVVLGRPAVTAEPRPREVAPAEGSAPLIDVEDAILGTFAPEPRPADLEETRERQILGGFSETELAGLRPEPRPVSAQESAALASLFPQADAPTGTDGAPGARTTPGATVAGTALAVPASRVPPPRPANIDALVAAAAATPGPAVATEAVARAPSIPSSADVTRAATERNAIRLRDVNLIGVTGTPSDRRALVRLPSGRFVRVGVGDRLDGGRVAAIGETTLQYVRNGRNVTLEIPG